MSAETDHHRARAKQELAQAENADDKAAAKIHVELAKIHARAAARLDRPKLGIVTEE